MSGTESRGRSGEKDDQLERSTKKVKAAAGLVDDSVTNPVVIGDEHQGAIDGGQQQDSGAGGGAQRESMVKPPTGDFGPWMIAQSRKPRRNVNHVPKSRAPVNSGGGEKAGSRFSALAEEEHDLNLENDFSHEEREKEVETWAQGVYKASGSAAGPRVGANKIQKHPRKSTSVGPTNVPEKAVGTTNVMESNEHDPNKISALRNHHRANMVKEKSLYPILKLKLLICKLKEWSCKA
ncbi:hypothetical protein COLO4_38060 [Corchorus olitorius]|uniref:Uncharacterized protein n=1 Tax=Corchorus olitorius TaxID=93759 RepID=A0A1R3FXE2_9ROSI|nr:hypothetical protein COLO4_38060 [Corchorus olitorius]